MSLINDALQDLANRNHHSVLQDERAPPQKNEPPGTRLLQVAVFFLTGIAITASLAASISYWTVDGASELSAAVPEVVTLTVNKKQEALHRDGEQENIGDNKDNPIREDVDAKIADKEMRDQQELSRLLNLAAASLQKNRLSRPEGDNALWYIRQALSIKQDSQKARAMLARIHQSYRHQLDAALRRKDRRTAEMLFGRSDFFDLEASEKRNIAQRLEMLKGDNLRPAVVSETDLQVARVTASQGRRTSVPRFRLSAEQQDLNAYTVAQRLLKLEGTAAARAMLNKFISTWPDAFHARVLFVDIALSEQDLAAVKRVLSTTSAANPAFRYMTSRLLALESDELSALALLEEKQATSPLNIYEKGFLAALCQKLGQEEKAFNLYRELIAEKPDELRFLLGYAITADILGKHHRSKKAYTQVLHQRHPDEKVTAFVLSRLAHIEESKLAEARPW